MTQRAAPDGTPTPVARWIYAIWQMYWRVGAPTVVSMNSTSQQTVMRPRVAVIVATAVCVAAPGARSGDRSARGTWQQLVNCAVTRCDQTFKHLRCVSTSGIFEDAAGFETYQPHLRAVAHFPNPRTTGREARRRQPDQAAASGPPTREAELART